MKKEKDRRQIAVPTEGMIQGDSAKYKLNQLPVKQGTPLKEGTMMEIQNHTIDNGASFIKAIKVYPAGILRNFEEARSPVINNYQQQLEQNWMKELMVKYPVTVNNSIFQTLLK